MRRSLAPALALLCLAASARAAHAQTRARVAILPVVVHSHDSQDYLRSGVADMLASRLGRTPGVGVIRVTDPGAATTDLAAAQAAGRAAGADYVLFGSFTRFGEGASLDVRCVGVNQSDESASRAVFIQSGALGEIIPRLDVLADKVGRYVASGGVSLPDVSAPAPAAASGLAAEVEALRARVEALEKALPGGKAPEGGPVSEVDLRSRERVAGPASIEERAPDLR